MGRKVKSKRRKKTLPLVELFRGVVKKMTEEQQQQITPELEELQRQGIRTYENLLDGLSYLSEADRSTVVWVLERLEKRSAGPRLLEVLVNDSSLSVRCGAGRALGVIGGKRVVSGLSKVVENSSIDPSIRAEACAGLAFLSEKIDTKIFRRLVGDLEEDPRVRSQAAEGLANHLSGSDRRRREWRRAVEVLLPCLNDSNTDVRFWAVFAVGSLNARVAVPRLRKLARRDDAIATGMWAVSEEAKDALHCIERGFWPELDAFTRTQRKPESQGGE